MRKKILVVDDYRELRELIVDYLEQRGYEVSSAADADDAIAQIV
jgi:CheY-like chemotaxis protein